MCLELEAVTQINEKTVLVHNHNYDNQVNNLKNNDIVYLKHFEDMESVFIIKDVKLFNEVMISTIKDECKLINSSIELIFYFCFVSYNFLQYMFN